MKRLQAKAWAARWRDLDVLEVAVLVGPRERLNLDMGKAVVGRVLADLKRTVDDGDAEHVFELGDATVHLPREHALSLREGLIRLLERGIWTAPAAGYHSENIRLARGSTVQLQTQWLTRWV